ncbi:XRE family transcriptional regulator [Coleofasciculus sp. H7-2]|uniref:XRE family transcriptional regulator n=1 Tax=Coleofasciculus sp. H7-2 TaxID=3351545 RepID=UPI00366C6F7D
MSGVLEHIHTKLSYNLGTSAIGAMLGAKRLVSTVKIGGYLPIENTLSEVLPDYWLIDLGTSTYTSRALRAPSSSIHGQNTPSDEEARTNEVTRVAIMELRRLSGLAWDQLAHLFGVSRRSMHLWASGKPMNTQNEERLHRLLALVKHFDRGSADENRRLLLTPVDSGENPIKLLAKGDFERVSEALGSGIGERMPSNKAISASSWEGRLPSKPEYLIDALHETIHRDPGGVRIAHVKRAKG